MSNLPIISDYDGELSAAPARPSTVTRQISPLQVIWRGRWIMLLCTALAGIGGYIYLDNQTPYYSSTSRIDVGSEVLRILNNNSDTGENRTTNYLATQCELIKSSMILGRVAENLSGTSPNLQIFGGETNSVTTAVTNATGALKAGVSATTSKLDDLITVSFESPQPSEAAKITNAIVEAYRDYQDEKKHKILKEVGDIITKEKNSRDDELAKLNQRMVDFKNAHTELAYVTGDGKTNIVMERLASLSQAQSTARLELLQAKDERDNAKSMSPQKLDQLIRQQMISNPITQEIHRLDIELKQIGATQGPQSRSFKERDIQLKALKDDQEQQVEEMKAAFVGGFDQRFEVAARREAEVTSMYAEQQKIAEFVSQKSNEYEAMVSDRLHLEHYVDLLENRLKELSLTQNAGAMNITILEVAKPGQSPVKPKWAIVLFEAIACGLALGGGLAYLRELMDHRLRTVEDIRTTLNLAVLGAVPRMAGKEAMTVRGQKVHIEPMSNIAEAYRTIRTAIYFGAREEKARTLVVTSPAPGDGKSTSASNLAISMAQAGQRVLLMDADLRKPVQHKIFKLDDTAGLTSVVSGKSPLSEAVKATDIPGLYVLPSGPIPRNPAEILTSAAFEKVLEKLRTKFDHIVIDSPPVAPVTDSGILGGLCDATIIVVRANKSTRKVSRQAVNYLLSVGSKMLGVIANEVGSNDGNYGYHGYGYGYYSTRGVLTTKHVKSIEGNGHAREGLTEAGATRE